MRKILILSYHGTFGNSERQEGRGTAKDTSHNCFCLQPVSLLFCFHMLYNEGATKWQLKRKEMATMQVVVYVGNRLKDLRIEQALTQRELAAKAGIGVNTVNRIELNETQPHMTTVRKLAAALGVEPRRLTKSEE
jgi:DNA-binding XRE family transcriptional regulator